jgi:hypothetical protein
MNDKRVEPRALLGGKYGANSAFVGRIGTKAIDGLGWKSDELATPDQLPGFIDCGWLLRDQAGCYGILRK